MYNRIMERIRVGVFAGGVSNEREVSLLSAAQVMKNLSTEKYDIRLVEVGTDGHWSFDGAVVPFGNTLGFDVALIAMHGTGAEDGRLQGLFETIGIPYTGSGVLASAIAMNKALTNELVAARGVAVPRWFELHRTPDDMTVLEKQVQEEIGYPCVVKPNESGSSVGVSIVASASALAGALAAAFKEDDSVLVQQCVKGREVSCGVLGNARTPELRALPVIEIVSPSAFFDYTAKYESKETREICPAELPEALTVRIQEASVLVHETLGCDGLTRADYIVGEDGVPYFLEINTIPGMTEMSLCPQEARAAGISFGELLDMQIEMAIRGIDK